MRSSLAATVLYLASRNTGEKVTQTSIGKIIASDITKKFYTDLFGWKIEKWPGTEDRHQEGYWLVTTTDAEGNQAVTGGIMKRQDLQGITNHFDVKSVQEYSSKVEKFGGKVITPKTPLPGVGYFAICKDTENNTFSIFEPDSTAK